MRPGSPVRRFLEKRLPRLSVSGPGEYAERLGSAYDPELTRLVHASTIGESWLFRDPRQIECIPSLLEELGVRTRRANLWVAGCSTAEDASSVALVTLHAGIDA